MAKKKRDTLDEMLDELENAGEDRPTPKSSISGLINSNRKATSKPTNSVDQAEIDELLQGGDPGNDSDGEPDNEPDCGLITSKAPEMEPLLRDLPLPTSSQVVRRSSTQTSVDPAVAVADMLSKVRDEFDLISNDVLGQWRSDRKQVQEVIDMFIESMHGEPNNSSKPIIEGLVKLLDTKVNSGMLAVKLLEVKTKLLMAIKSTGGITINNQNLASAGQNSELTELLSSPEESDFE
jgi:hypothetical protein